MITTETTGATIRYTLDGSTPTATTGTVYSTPLTINKTTVLRAAAFKTGYQRAMSTRRPTCFWPTWSAVAHRGGAGRLADRSGQRPGDQLRHGPGHRQRPHVGPAGAVPRLKAIPTISIVTDVSNLFDPTTGIYVNADQTEAGQAGNGRLRWN